MFLPAAVVPFFMEAPFKVKADIYKMGIDLVGQKETHLFHLDDSYETFTKAKLKELTYYSGHARCYMKDELESLEACLWQLAEQIAKDQPEYFSFEDDRFTAKLLGLSITRHQQERLLLLPEAPPFADLGALCFEHLDTLEAFDQLCDFLALAVQEDLVIMHKTGSGTKADRAECLLVALPSHWDPLEKCGLDFGAIHEPVADNAILMKSQNNMLKAMTKKGPFVRYNWSLASTHVLAQNPALLPREPRLLKIKKLERSDDLLKALHYRVERQTFFPFPELNRGLFAIRIYQEPLQKTLTIHKRKEQLLDAINTMSEGMLHYKGIDRYKDAILDCLRN